MDDDIDWRQLAAQNEEEKEDDEEEAPVVCKSMLNFFRYYKRQFNCVNPTEYAYQVLL